MLTYSGFFVALWCLPVILFIIIPLAMFAGWMLRQVSRKAVAPSRSKRPTEYEKVIILTEAQQA